MSLSRRLSSSSSSPPYISCFNLALVVGVTFTLFSAVVVFSSSKPSSAVAASPEQPLFPPDGEVSVTLCKDESFNNITDGGDEEALIYFVTPTYSRREQIAELTRLGNTLLSVQVTTALLVCHTFLAPFAEFMNILFYTQCDQLLD